MLPGAEHDGRGCGMAREGEKEKEDQATGSRPDQDDGNRAEAEERVEPKGGKEGGQRLR